jgi:hypothetical protein
MRAKSHSSSVKATMQKWGGAWRDPLSVGDWQAMMTHGDATPRQRVHYTNYAASRQLGCMMTITRAPWAQQACVTQAERACGAEQHRYNAYDKATDDRKEAGCARRYTQSSHTTPETSRAAVQMYK